MTADADKARARAILREAGYWNDETDSSNLVLRLSLAEQNEPGGQVIARDLREIGIQVEIEPSDKETALEKWLRDDFDAGLHDFPLISIDTQLVLLRSSFTATPNEISAGMTARSLRASLT